MAKPRKPSRSVENLLHKATASAAGKRVPKEEPLFLASLSFANDFLGRAVEDRIFEFAHKLRHAAEYYYRAADSDAIRPTKRGRPLVIADVMFVYAMADAYAFAIGTSNFGYRSYDCKARERAGGHGGAERPTVFQAFCQGWMRYIDPKRPKAISAAAFKKAQAERKRRHSGE